MNLMKVVAFIGLLAMTTVLIYGFVIGNFTAEGSQLLSMPWGIVSLVDLYVGFSLFSCWIVFREKSTVRSIFWVVLVMVTGFWTGCIYMLIALYRSDGNWNKFWLGNRV